MSRHVGCLLYTSFAAELKAKAEAENQAQRSENTARNAAEYRRIRSVATSIDSVRSVFRSILEKMDFEMKEYMEHCNELQISFEEGESAYLSQEPAEMDIHARAANQ